MAKKPDVAAEAPKPAGGPDEFIKVIGPEDGRWRAGIKFGPLGTVLCLADLDADAFAAISSDELLDVRRIEAAKPAA